MIRLGATEDECADLLIRVLCRAFACTVTTVQNGGSVRICECRSCWLGMLFGLRRDSLGPAQCPGAGIC
jgi:hypothetical protein